MFLTTVARDYAVFHEGTTVHRVDNLEPDRSYEEFGIGYRTLPSLGARLASFATVNDVHFGETECGATADPEMEPIFRVDEGDMPYPELMNRAAVSEILSLEPDVVLVKGDLTCDGTDEQYSQFLDCYEAAFGSRLYHIRGNHESYQPPGIQTETQIQIDLPGVTLAMIDTVRPGLTGGTVYDEDLEWLAALSDAATQPVLVFGHHQIWDPSSRNRSKDYFGIQPDESEKFIDMVRNKPNLKGYFCGHTHRNRTRYFPATGEFPWVEVACVKDFPGTWAQYEVFEQGILQIHHRISTPGALEWSEKTKVMYRGTYFDYAIGDLSDRCFVVHRF